MTIFRSSSSLLLGFLCLLATTVSPVRGDEARLRALTKELQALDAKVYHPGSAEHKKLLDDIRADVSGRRDRLNRESTAAWQNIKDKADWGRFVRAKLEALKTSLGHWPPVPETLRVRVTRKLPGDGFVIENIVFESRPGLLVTANLYSPAKPAASMPGILICHSHHNPKSQGELQDMGMTWARQGCLVLVPDMLGHGERRQHPFTDASTYKGSFKPGRQDYYFRYNVALQLHLIGDGLMGWMVWDLMRGVDLLLSRPGIDKDRIILLGAVAGGGDPAAVTAALDPRIRAVVPFNFGGPQPETKYPLPEDADKTFNYAGSGSWESTRNLRRSAADGFLPWVIVGSVAPRGLIHAHEFAWDRERDPVWKRLEKIYGFYDARDKLAFAHGRGKLTGQPPESTHCNNIGAEHRKHIHPTLEEWFRIPIPEKEYQKRFAPEELRCLTKEAQTELRGKSVHELATELGRQRLEVARKRLAQLPPKRAAAQLRADWAELLGATEFPPGARPSVFRGAAIEGIAIERYLVPVATPKERDRVEIPLLILVPKHQKTEKISVVMAIAQTGKQGFLRHRADTVARLLQAGVAVCLPDLRGTGEAGFPGDSRRRSSASTSLSATELMLGETLLGARLRDLTAVLAFLRERATFDPARIALWGDSFAPVNSPDDNLQVPLDADKLPDQAEPLGGLLTLFGALNDDKVKVVYAHGGLGSYLSVLESPFSYLPHDAVVPGALTAGDLADVAAALAPRSLRLEGLVDGLNRRLSTDRLTEIYRTTRAGYQDAKAADRFSVQAEPLSDERLADWFIQHLKVKVAN
jgi:dienelactone hydrolase